MGEGRKSIEKQRPTEMLRSKMENLTLPVLPELIKTHPWLPSLGACYYLLYMVVHLISPHQQKQSLKS